MKELKCIYVGKNETNDYSILYEAKFSFSTIRQFYSEAKMNEWIENTKKTHSFNYEPEIKVFKRVIRIVTNGKLQDIYEEVK